MSKRRSPVEQFDTTGQILPLPVGYALKRAGTRTSEIRYGLVAPDGFWRATSIWEIEAHTRAFAEAMQLSSIAGVSMTGKKS